MTYQGNLAYQLDEWQVTQERRPWEVHEGGRRASSPQVHEAPWALIRVAAALLIAFAVFGCIRIKLVTMTVDTLQSLRVAENTVEDTLATRTELQVERSVLSSADRIQRIATENYGMVLASEVDTITLPASSQPETTEEETADLGFDLLASIQTIFS